MAQPAGDATAGDIAPGAATGGDTTPDAATGGDTTPGAATDGDTTRGAATGGDTAPALAGSARGSLPLMAMPSARVQRAPWPTAHELLSGLAESLRNPRGAADELDDARELLAYWEQRARALPRWAVMRRREARAMAMRWRERVRLAEQERYGHGLLGAASQFALERRMPTTVAHRGRQAARVALYTAATAALTLLLVLAAAIAVVAEAVVRAL